MTSPPGSFRSLHQLVLLWLIAPFAIILVAALGAAITIYQNSATQLALERHQQLANLAAVTVSQGIEGSALILEGLSASAGLHGATREVRQAALFEANGALAGFQAGVIQVDAQGRVITASPGQALAQWDALPDPALLERLRAGERPVLSGVTALPGGKAVVLVGVPVLDEGGALLGAVFGGIDLNDPGSSITNAVQKLTTSTPGIAILVDERGRVISHPDPGEIGSDYSDRPYFGNAVRGARGGVLWRSPQGERFVGAEARVTPSGWSVIIKEPWNAILAPVRRSTLILFGSLLLALGLFVYLSWAGARRVTGPIQALSAGTALLAAGETVPAVGSSQIVEIDALRSAFTSMASQISSYRDGLRHYVTAITNAQEEERMRIARDLHDETVQNLLAVYRRVEILQADESDPKKQEQLGSLREMIGQTLRDVRQVSQELRPMMLDDLGFVPALQRLVRSAHEGPGAVPHVNMEVHGEARELPAGVELALYRIAQEAINNVRKHARATSIEVTLEYQPASTRLVISDDGSGFVVPPSFTELVKDGNLGLMGIQERAWAAGGTLTIDSRPDQGTEIAVTVPLGER